MEIQVQDLGKVNYQCAWDLQKKLLDERIADKIPDQLLILEHEPVITVGRRTKDIDVYRQGGIKEVSGIPVVVVERGGEITYHGPGQVVIYPIVKISKKLGPRGFLQFLENAIIQSLAKYGLKTRVIPDATGVWTSGAASPKKVASIGIAVRHGVSYHGLAVNVDLDLEPFFYFQPCGFSPSVMANVREFVPCSLADIKLQLSTHIKTNLVSYKNGLSVPMSDCNNERIS